MHFTRKIVSVLSLGAAVVLAAPVTADAANPAAARTHAQANVACARGFVCIYPDMDFRGQPYVKRASDGSVSHLPDYIRSNGSSVINNSSRTARVYQNDNYGGRRVCVGRNGGSIQDLRSYQLNDTTHSLRNNDTACGG
ncbi:peptidase inhibitor family I36 protein [Streptomyces sp. NBC_00258]|uniref:peptidase inhibitor family I36 protein n=1 Tax=Streptomyces sp. NBC_00258 TaxID=2903642 RepID=UPI002E29B97E|nr:peptidase inhibitor family I36 protein [Streptomyces sp. NBC_00258]